MSYQRHRIWGTAFADGNSRREGSRAHAHPRRSRSRDGLLFLSILLVKGCSDYEEPRSFASVVASTYAALNRALSLPEEERRKRALRPRRAVLPPDSGRWLQVLHNDLARIDDIKPAPTAA